MYKPPPAIWIKYAVIIGWIRATASSLFPDEIHDDELLSVSVYETKLKKNVTFESSLDVIGYIHMLVLRRMGFDKCLDMIHISRRLAALAGDVGR